MTFIYNMADTWNAIGTTFNAIYMNVSDGAAGPAVGAAASRAFRLDNDGTPIFEVDISGAFVGQNFAAIGNYASFTEITFSPGDPTFESTTPLADFPVVLLLNNHFSGDLSGKTIAGLMTSNNVKHTGVVSGNNIIASDNLFAIASDSTGDFNELTGGVYEVYNLGSGNINTQFGFVGITGNYGDNGTVTNQKGLYLINLMIPEAGDTATTTNMYGVHIDSPFVIPVDGVLHNNYGLYVSDQSGIADTLNYNIYSEGDGINWLSGWVQAGGFLPSDISVDNIDTKFSVSRVFNNNVPAVDLVEGITCYISVSDTANPVGTPISAADIRVFILDTNTQDVFYASGTSNTLVNNSASGTVENLIGFNNSIGSESGGTTNTMVGVQTESVAGGDGVVDLMKGFNTATGFVGTVAVTDSIGFNIESPDIEDTPTITNNYGLYIEDQAGVADTLNYNIYSEGDGINWLSGWVQVGGALPFDVTGIDVLPNLSVAKIYVNDTPIVELNAGVSVNISYSDTANALENIGAMFNTVNIPATHTQNIGFLYGTSNFMSAAPTSGDIDEYVGFNNETEYVGSGTVGAISAVRSFVAIDSGSVGFAAGTNSEIFFSGTAAVVDAFGMVISTPGVEDTPTITNNYGLFIGDQSGIADTLNYNIYSEGDGINWLSGWVQAGGHLPSEVTGDSIDSALSSVRKFVDNAPTVDTISAGSFYVSLSETTHAIGSITSLDTRVYVPTTNTQDIEFITGTGNFLDIQPVSGLIELLFGVYQEVNYGGGGTLGEQTGILSLIGADGGTIGEVFGIHSATGVSGTTVVERVTGINISLEIDDTPTIANTCGLFIGGYGSAGTVSNYNIFSEGDGSEGFNLFQAQTGFGNYGTDKIITYYPGDPIYADPQPNPRGCIIINNYYEVDGAFEDNILDFAVFTGIKHTGSGEPGFSSIRQEPTINSDSTGTFDYIRGGYYNVTNFGQGNIGDAAGLFISVGQVGAGSMTNMFSIAAGNAIDATTEAAAVENLYGIRISGPELIGVTDITNNVGLEVQSQGGIASDSNYNILSYGPGFNLFQDTVGVGNTVTDTTRTFAPGDPLYEEVLDIDPGTRGIIINNFYNGDFSGESISDIEIFAGIKHTGAGESDYTALGMEPTINSDSTGDFDFMRGAQYQITNSGAGHINVGMGMFCRAANRGAGIIGDLRGVVASNVIDASVETAEVVTQTTLLVVAPELTGVTTITDNYGLYIGDHSGQASGDNFNIWSQGASSENLFDGLIQTGSLRIDQAPTANISAATTITSGADSATNLGHRVMINLNGVDYWIPCGTTPF